MATQMSQIKTTAHAHIRRDLALTRKWICECEPCREMRSLVSMDKMLDVHPLVREIGQVEDQLRDLPEGPEMSALLEHYLSLHDKLAEVVAQTVSAWRFMGHAKCVRDTNIRRAITQRGQAAIARKFNLATESHGITRKNPDRVFFYVVLSV